MAEFVHLHVHSQYSMLDGAIRLKELVERAAGLGFPALGLTDHGNMFGAVQFHHLCLQNEIEPIIGCEIGFVGGDRRDTAIREAHHLLLLAENQTGYKNLVRLVSRAWVEGLVHGAPRADFELLREHHEGLVCLSACMGGYLAQEILHRGPTAGRQAMGTLRDCFAPGRFWVELQDHGFPEQKPLNQILVELAAELGVGVVATNDCHFLDASDARAQLALQCIAAGRTLEEMGRTHHQSTEPYLKSTDEMVARFGDVPGAIANSLRIAEMCAGNVSPLAQPKLPRFDTPGGASAEDYLVHLSQQGLGRRIDELNAIGQSVDTAHYRARLQGELAVITKMKFAGYFLIVQDFINWAKTQNIPVGPGRGSGAGSLVAYALRITDLDPVHHKLLFERFMNPERVSMPDFDIDFCMQRRDEVIQYVRQKYGAASVGQIATFHLLKSKSVVRDVGRVMGMPVSDAARIAELVPEPVQGKSITIAQALEQEARLKTLYDDDPTVHTLLDTALALEDLTRHAGMHAAGIVISEGPLWDHVPVFCPEPGSYVTQYHKDDVESAGLVKFDLLGLRTLTVIDIACRLINRRPDRKDEPLRIERIPMDDEATFALLRSGETTNLFQLESSGMQTLFKQLKPDCFEDIVAAVALYRPGPLGSGMVEDFVQRKHGRIKVQYPHPSLEPILKETYGVIVYQEQVMQIARDMAGYSLGGADILRRAMGKKKAEEMEKQKAIFRQGAESKGVSRSDAERVFDLMAFFAGYGFNKSHSAAYALISYQTAFLKAHYPVEFECATMSADKDKIDKVVRTVAEARSMGITVLPPDVNESDVDFTVVYEPSEGVSSARTARRRSNQPVCFRGEVRDPTGPKVRFGLGAIKGIGAAAVEAIFEARGAASERAPFVDLFDFASRVDLRRVNKHVVEALVQSGAFDAVHERVTVGRAQAYAAIDTAIDRGKKLGAERLSGQTNLFGLFTAGDAATDAPAPARFQPVEPWDTRETLSREKASLGFYVSGHPLDRYAAELRRFCSATTETLGSLPEGAQVTVGGSVEAYRERNTKTGGRIAFFALEDPRGRIEVIVRPRILETDPVRKVLASGEPVVVSGIVRFEQDRNAGGAAHAAGEGVDGEQGDRQEVKLLLDSVAPLAESLVKKTRSVRVRLPIERVHREQLVALRTALLAHPGPCPVTLELSSTEQWSVSMPGCVSVEPSDALMAQLERLFGQKVFELR